MHDKEAGEELESGTHCGMYREIQHHVIHPQVYTIFVYQSKTKELN